MNVMYGSPANLVLIRRTSCKLKAYRRKLKFHAAPAAGSGWWPFCSTHLMGCRRYNCCLIR
jgi:hypothetical protein